MKRGIKKEQTPKRLPDIIIQRKHNNFTIISNEAIRNPNMSWKAKGLLTLLIGNKKGWYSYKETIKKYGSDREKSVSSGLKELEKNGYLVRLRYRKKKGPNKQIIGSVWLCTDTINEFDWDTVYAQLAMYGLEPISTKPKYGNATNTFPTSTKGTMNERYNERKVQLTIPINNNTKINNINLERKENLYLDDFEEWYKHYPKKMNKQGAKKSWIKIFNLPKKDKPSFETLLSAVKQQSKSNQWQNKQYIPYPSTWLNRESWNDELQSNQSNQSNSSNQYQNDETTYQNNNKPKFNPLNPNNDPDLPGYQLTDIDLMYEKDHYDPFDNS